jgi:hypothetical protein
LPVWVASNPRASLSSRAARRVDREFVAEAAGATQAQPEAAACGKSIRQCQVDVFDSGALIAEGEAHSLARAIQCARNLDFAAVAIVQGVAGDLARGRHQLGLVDE